MPGILGYVRDLAEPEAKGFFSAMARALEPDQRDCRVECHCDQRGAIGRVSLGILNPETQPVWNSRGNRCLVLEGEIVNSRELREDLLCRGNRIEGGSDADLLLSLFDTFGDGFAEKLNGAFAVALWDVANRRLLLTNDRLGLYPVYYAKVDGHLVFASGVRALLADPALSRRTDTLAIAEFLTFDHVLDDRTLVQSVKLLPQASVLSFSDGQLQIRRYWQLKYPDRYQIRTEEEYLEGLDLALDRAIERQPPRNQAAGLLLSGGLDSRVLLAYLCRQGCARELHTFTWGIPGCDDARIARELARLSGTRHHFFRLRPDYLLSKAEEAVRITDGQGNIVNLHALAITGEAAACANIIYKGFLGDAMMGFALQRPFWATYDSPTARMVHLGIHDYQGVLNYHDDQLRALFQDPLSREVADQVFDSYSAAMLRSGSTQLATQRLFYDLTQRVPRMTLNGVEVVRSRAAVRLPFADNDLVDFSVHVPPGFHFERYLVRTAFLRKFPEYSKVPAADTGLPLISCARDIRLRLKQLAQWHINRTGIPRLQWPSRRPYKDYAAWFRTVLKSWVEATLLSPECLSRGYFEPDYIRNLVSDHMSGANHTVRLGAFLTLELWHRQFID